MLNQYQNQSADELMEMSRILSGCSFLRTELLESD